MDQYISKKSCVWKRLTAKQVPLLPSLEFDLNATHNVIHSIHIDLLRNQRMDISSIAMDKPIVVKLADIDISNGNHLLAVERTHGVRRWINGHMSSELDKRDWWPEIYLSMCIRIILLWIAIKLICVFAKRMGRLGGKRSSTVISNQNKSKKNTITQWTGRDSVLDNFILLGDGYSD